MSERVLSTGEAKQAIQRIQQLINSGLTEQIDALNHEGQTLSDPNVWDGNLAQQFRSDWWPNMHNRFLQAKQSLEELRTQIEGINQNIMQAGGN